MRNFTLHTRQGKTEIERREPSPETQKKAVGVFPIGGGGSCGWWRGESVSWTGDQRRMRVSPRGVPCTPSPRQEIWDWTLELG